MGFIVAWTARQALMLEMIWPLPWEVSVPGGGRQSHAAQAASLHQGVDRAGGGVARLPSLRTMMVGVCPPNDMMGGGGACCCRDPSARCCDEEEDDDEGSGVDGSKGDAASGLVGVSSSRSSSSSVQGGVQKMLQPLAGVHGPPLGAFPARARYVP